MKLTICIPKVDSRIKKKFIKEVFIKFDFGFIKKIDLIQIDKSQRCFIHYNYWNDNELSKEILDILNNGQDFKIMYHDPWYWKCSAFRSPNNNI